MEKTQEKCKKTKKLNNALMLLYLWLSRGKVASAICD